ncbi:cysteine synthase A [Candidatus Woesebacteria bacterium]|nr:cysteine synthase A [Candidatus Woesebacteria bacterium]
MRYKNILGTIGNTPLVRIGNINPKGRAEIYAKFEALNPSGSIKDRMAIYMVHQAEKKGLLKLGATIIEATTGNTGIAFSMIAAVKGYKMIAVMPENMTAERKLMMQAYGAKIITTPAHLGPKGAIAKRDKLAKKIKNSWVPNQFDNSDNPKAHESTAQEIIAHTKGKVDAFVAGVGTGGTFMGIAKVLKKVNPKVIVVAVEPAESAVLNGESEGNHNIQGIGEGFIPKLVNLRLIDRLEKVSTKQAVIMAKRIAKKEGMLVGTSSGANLVASLQVAKKLTKGKTIITIFPDRGERYLSEYCNTERL